MAKGHSGIRAVHLLLLIPFVVMMWVPFYNRALPEVAGIPFFYWYQLLWIPLGALLLLLVYRIDERSSRGAE